MINSTLFILGKSLKGGKIFFLGKIMKTFFFKVTKYNSKFLSAKNLNND